MIIAQGAEAILKKEGDIVIKERISKTYRHPKLDAKIRKFRTRREAKVMDKLTQAGIPCPKLHHLDDQQMTVRMDFLPGKLLKDVIDKNPLQLCQELGRKIGKIHTLHIVHGDLTTSNMIVDKEISFIDFGLSFFSEKIEDKAVDLHVLEQAFQSTHYELYELYWNAIIQGYKRGNPEHATVLKRLKAVQSRGRYKKKGQA